MLCGLAQSQGLLIGARFVQGIGGAMTSAVILGMIVTMFPKPAEQAKAIAVYSFVAAAGGAVGLLLGGIITQSINWHWIFFVNLPIGIATALATHPGVTCTTTRVACQQRRGTDAAPVPASQSATSRGQTDATLNVACAPRGIAARQTREMGSVRMLRVVPVATVQSWLPLDRTVRGEGAVRCDDGEIVLTHEVRLEWGQLLQPHDSYWWRMLASVGIIRDPRGGESFGDEPDREDQLEEATGDQREHPGAVSHVDQVEHGQDRAYQEHRVAIKPSMDTFRGTSHDVHSAEDRMSPAAPETA
jgi:Major Facilitator Superfamily